MGVVLDKSELISLMSGNFLCEDIPRELVISGDKKVIDDFVEEYAWQPLENTEADAIWGLILAAAGALEQFLATKGIKVHEDRKR